MLIGRVSDHQSYALVGHRQGGQGDHQEHSNRGAHQHHGLPPAYLSVHPTTHYGARHKRYGVHMRWPSDLRVTLMSRTGTTVKVGHERSLRLGRVHVPLNLRLRKKMQQSQRLPGWALCHEHRRSKRRCATVLKMKEGPSGSAIRSLIPSHRELLRSKALVVSVAETSGR